MSENLNKARVDFRRKMNALSEKSISNASARIASVPRRFELRGSLIRYLPLMPTFVLSFQQSSLQTLRYRNILELGHFLRSHVKVTVQSRQLRDSGQRLHATVVGASDATPPHLQTAYTRYPY